MDADRFDSLTRTLTTAGSRRRALALAISGALGSLLTPYDAEAHDALEKCKKLKGDKKKKCLKKAKKHDRRHASCTPNCAGKDCGPDGCGRSCGACTGGDCVNGTCDCPDGQELCGGVCREACPTGSVRLPATCNCCNPPDGPCNQPTPDPTCCSGLCTFLGTGVCRGLGEGSSCQIDEQCDSGICRDGFCRCPSGKEPCLGGCYDPCPAGEIRRPNTVFCPCCITNGTSCAGDGDRCCAGPDRCTGPNGTCEGLPDGTECDFTEQCADQFPGCLGEVCGGANQ